MQAPLTARAETVAVMRAMAVVFFGAWTLIGLRAGAPPGTDTIAASDLLPWQKLFRDEDPALQRRYRAMEEGIAEAERGRASTKAWPGVEALAADGVPPFALDPIERGGYAWSEKRDGLVINYRGEPSGDAPELLVVIQEPEPGAVDLSAQSTVVDETHHTLSDGTLLHVTFWYRAKPSRADASGVVVDRPFAEGWTQILSGQNRKDSSS